MKLKSIVMVAGEASGDLHASHLIHALREQHGPLYVCGMGGKAMREAGATILIDADKLAVVGITEVIAKAAEVMKAMAQLKRLLSGLRPDLLVLIDYPEFNLHLAASAKKLGIKVLYYVSPQLWAWRSGRVKKIKKRVDHMAVILPFEKAFYQQHDVPVSYVGHPLMDSATGRAPLRRSAPVDVQAPVLGFLPGSRVAEVSSLLPIMLQAGQLLQNKMSNARFVISCAQSIDEVLIRSILDKYALRDVEITHEPVGELFPRCRLAIVASGTVTLEAAIRGTPMIVTYVVSPLSYLLGRALIRVEHIALVNLIAQKRIVTELIQHEVTAEAICDDAYTLISDPEKYARVCRELSIVRERLGCAGASRNVAGIACSLMECNHADPAEQDKVPTK
jgi:lipid-A-disaccharide synthase